MTPAIQTHALSKGYGSFQALAPLDLVVPQGAVFALVGHNGAGKTTLIKLLMNILVPSSGSATVLGQPATSLTGASFTNIGYVSENQEMPEWMTVGTFMNYLRSFYPTWDDAELIRHFDIPLNRKLKHLSRGMKMKAALASVLAFHPALILMDEPFSGLDPLVRDELITALQTRMAETATTPGSGPDPSLSSAAAGGGSAPALSSFAGGGGPAPALSSFAAGGGPAPALSSFAAGGGPASPASATTILISSHDLGEIESFATHVGFLHQGKLLFAEPMATLTARFREISVILPPPAAPPAAPAIVPAIVPTTTQDPSLLSSRSEAEGSAAAPSSVPAGGGPASGLSSFAAGGGPASPIPFTTATPPPSLPAIPFESWIVPEISSTLFRFVHTHADTEPVAAQVAQLFPNATSIHAEPMTLRTIFLALAKSGRVPPPPPESARTVKQEKKNQKQSGRRA